MANVNDDLMEQDYNGSYRHTPKTTVARKNGKKVPTTVLASTTVLRQTLAADVQMFPKVTTTKPRVAEELRNVRVTGFIQAVKTEQGAKGDHDFHIILSDSATFGQGTLMNIEVSGLKPDSPDAAVLRAARRMFIDLFPDVPFSGTFQKFRPGGKRAKGVKVIVEGSLFFDGDHQANGSSSSPGPAGAKPMTSWEIHPVTSIRAA